MLASALAALGLTLLVLRMGPRRAPAVPPPAPLAGLPRVSVIIPARDEARNLPRLLRSLSVARPAPHEVIVVDDRSEDDTASLAARGGARVVTGAPTPAGWSGKAWACAQGAEVATGDLLLFTDADTVHKPDSLGRAVQLLSEERAALVSALPWHDAVAWWERLLGPFHVLLLAVTAPHHAPSPRRVFAIGQYLLFRRAAYDALGGHAAVRSAFVEDVPLASLCLARGFRYRVYRGPPLFEVRMYETFAAFVRGWRRNFRAGLRYTTSWAPVEMALFLMAVSGGAPFAPPAWSTALALASMVALVIAQRPLGRFSVWGAILWPFALATLVLVTLLAVYDEAFKRPLRWKGRTYA